MSFKEECLSGKYSDMGLLQRTVRGGVEEVETVSTEQFMSHVHKAQPLVIRGMWNSYGTHLQHRRVQTTI